MLDAAFGEDAESFRAQVRGLAERLARHGDHARWLEEKRRRRGTRRAGQAAQRLPHRGARSLVRCFFGADRSYHEARSRFVHKLGAPCAVAPPAEAAMTLLQAAVGRRAAVGS